MQELIFSVFVCCLIPFCSGSRDLRPVVIFHGIAADSDVMDEVLGWIQDALPGIYIKNVEIGDGYLDSFFMNMNDQVENFCSQMASDSKLANGFNLLGYSQGGLVSRGFVERCNYPPVHNFITWSAPHGGQFGIPSKVTWTWLAEWVASIPYDFWMQDEITFAEYWKDPYNLDEYLQKSQYLADINNEKDTKNITYKKNMMNLNNLVLFYSEIDKIVIPKQSGWFEFYEPNSQNDSSVVPLKKSDLYIDDWIGLRYLDEQGRLYLDSCNCSHHDYIHAPCRDFFEKFTLPFLNNTFN